MIVCILAASLVTADTPVAAAQSAASNLTLTAATESALQNNAQLKSLRADWEAQSERPVQAGALPNPTLMFGNMDTTWGGDWPDAAQKRVSLQQAFPWFGKRRLRERIAAKDAETAKHELDAMTRDVVMQVKQTFYDLYAQQRVIAVTREETAVLQRIAEIAKTMYAAGSREQTDMIQAQTELTRLRQQLLSLAAQEGSLRARLNALLDRRADTPLPPLAKPPEATITDAGKALFDQAAEHSPEVLAAQTRVERSSLQERLMEKESKPDYQLGLEYRELRDNDDMLMVTVGVDLPIWLGKNRAAVREASKMREASEAARQAAERENAFFVDDARSRFEAARRTLDLTRTELIPQAEARLNAHEAAYRNGKADFMDLLGSERFLLDTRIMEIRAEAELGSQAARFERAAGTAAYSVPEIPR